MGKIRIKSFDEEQEEKDKKLKAKREGKKAEKKADVYVSDQKEPSTIEDSASSDVAEKPQTTDKKAKKTSKKKVVKRVFSARYKENTTTVGKNQNYTLDQAVSLLKKLKQAKFDETVELHINLKEAGVSGTISLPHGTGKKVRVEIANDALIEAVSKGKIDFDVLVATPDMMPKLAKVARILGPRGLMPNPKAGTVTNKPDEMVEKLSKGQVSYKSEAKTPILHMSVGKVSFSDKQLQENINTVLKSIPNTKIENITLKSTMSPAIKLSFA